jgi:hypothetical protein
MNSSSLHTLQRLLDEGIDSQRAHIEQKYIISKEGRFFCVLCENANAKHGGWCAFNQDNIASHIWTNHTDQELFTSQEYRACKRQRDMSQQLPVTHFFKTQESCKTGLQYAIRMIKKHPAMPLKFFDSKEFLAPWVARAGVTRESVTTAILLHDREMLTDLKQHIHNRLVGGQIDGGKDVNSDKQIGEGLVVDARFYCWDLEQPETGTYYGEEFYRDKIKGFIVGVEECGALMAGITMDNEPALNAGMRALLQDQRFKHVVHNRCTVHTGELLLCDVQHNIPKLQLCVAACHDIVTAVRNKKVFKDALKLSQEAAGFKPKRLIKCVNTRKWSSGFLMLSRVQQVYPHLAALGQFVSADDQPARREWDSTFALRLINDVSPTVLQACVNVLYWIYIGEQVLQRDSSSVIHASHVFEEICAILGNHDVSDAQKISPILLADANIAEIALCISKRRETVLSSGVYNISLCMWPLTDNQLVDTVRGMDELENLVDKCWDMWQAKKEVFGSAIPIQYRVRNVNDHVEMQMKRDAFKNDACSQLTSHMIASSQRIVRAKSAFTQTSRAIFRQLCAVGVPKVLRGTLQPDRFKLIDYWKTIQAEVPALFVVFLALNAICATEAGCERIFSKEGFIHHELRNRMHHNLVVAIMRIAMNDTDFDGALNDRWIFDFDDDIIADNNSDSENE